MHKQMMKKVDIFEHLKEKGFDIAQGTCIRLMGSMLLMFHIGNQF